MSCQGKKSCEHCGLTCALSSAPASLSTTFWRPSFDICRWYTCHCIQGRKSQAPPDEHKGRGKACVLSPP